MRLLVAILLPAWVCLVPIDGMGASGRSSEAQQSPPQQAGPPPPPAQLPGAPPIFTGRVGQPGPASPPGQKVLPAPAVMSRPSARFQLLFLQYRKADSDVAINALTKWTEGEVIAEAVPSPNDDVWARAALAALLTETGMRKGMFGYFSVYSPKNILLKGWGLDKNFEVYSFRSETLIRELIRIGNKTHDDALLTFCSHWYVQAVSYSFRYRRASLDGLQAMADHELGETAPIRLLIGSLVESRVGPFMPTAVQPCLGWMMMGPDGCVIRKDALHSPTQEALYLLKHAITADPSLIEAHLRLGRLLHLINEDVEAKPHLERAFHDAQAQEVGFLIYMSGLFLGDFVEHEGKFDEAIPYFRAALAAAPTAHIANVALGEALLKSGNERGWDEARHMFDDEDQGHPKVMDPWFFYRYAQYWQVASGLREMRDLVRGKS